MGCLDGASDTGNPFHSSCSGGSTIYPLPHFITIFLPALSVVKFSIGVTVTDFGLGIFDCEIRREKEANQSSPSFPFSLPCTCFRLSSDLNTSFNVFICICVERADRGKDEVKKRPRNDQEVALSVHSGAMNITGSPFLG